MGCDGYGGRGGGEWKSLSEPRPRTTRPWLILICGSFNLSHHQLKRQSPNAQSRRRSKENFCEYVYAWLICCSIGRIVLFPTAFLSASRSSGKAEPCATGRRPWWVTLYFHLFWTSEREVPHCSAHITPDRRKASCPVYFSWATSHATHPYSGSFFCSMRSASSDLIHNTPTI